MTAVLDLARACHSKQRYGTEEIAKSAALKCWRERGVDLRVYACACGGFHLTKLAAPPVMQPGWRYPATSQRQQAHERKQRRRGRR